MIDKDRHTSSTILKKVSVGEVGVPACESISLSHQSTDRAYLGHLVEYGEYDADSVRVYLKGAPATTLIFPNKTVVLPAVDKFQCSLRDLRPYQAWHADYELDMLTFDLPSAALTRWCQENGVRTLGGLRFDSGARHDDEVLQGFARCALPFINQPNPVPGLFLDYLLHGVATYMTRTYGVSHEAARFSGGLAAWQEKRSKEIIDANLDARISLKMLAEECRLSVSHFTKAFRRSTGQTPYQWLISRRIERAKAMLLSEECSLLNVGVRCGFADQSHFTRVFGNRVGASPAAWRRHHCAGTTDRIS